ncbi:acetylornithine deacetylase [Alterinioella nitratireducens]|uniref:acetylornithine deacetylase n=1 Tax=Alterinioella nitratireducens TaxID=2735915 RepID=UPI001557F5DB|nr:acetylornithine deacetylase [Alterinioella nitratireducens]NPD21345.1 acetylornithine deacetylase [Alterinioella nitratireducens]
MTTAMTSRQILEKLVSFPTVSSESNLDLVDWVEGYLNDLGVTCHRDYTEDGRKASLFAHIGPEVEGGVILSGHTDVVPVEGQAWSTDPFTVVERDGKLFGRGTCDMKGFDALALGLAARAAEAPLTRPLQICLSRDEEIGCIGAPPMIRAMQGVVPKAALAIIGEPSMMQAVTGHKGGIGFVTHVRGFEVHSSLIDRGVSAIMEAAKLIDWGNRMNAENRARGATGADALFDPPYTTLHVGVIEGGTAHNITAKDCHFLMSFRCVPGEDADEWGQRYVDEVRKLEAQMQAVRPSSYIELSSSWNVPGLRPEENGEAEALVRRLTGDNATHVVSYGTEAGQFQTEGYSAVVCGPGDIAQAHQPDEFISVAQFEAGEAFMDRLLKTLCE